MPNASEGDLRVRRVAPADSAPITAIYNHYIESSAITFDVEPYTLAEREPWLEQFRPSGRHQLFVAERAGRVIGYAGSMQYRPKAAYETSVETTIYIAPDEVARGVGPRLYEALFASLAGEDVHRALAGITLPNDASLRLHERFAFTPVGTYSEVGRKLGRYWDVIWLEKRIG